MQKKQKAFSVIEVVLSAALFAVFSLGITLAVLQGSSATQTELSHNEARLWAMEGVEALRAIHLQAFDSLGNTEASGIIFEDGKWKLFGLQDEKDGLARVISIQNAQRDENNNIVISTGTEDLDLKLATVTVKRGNELLADYSLYLSRREVVVSEPPVEPPIQP